MVKYYKTTGLYDKVDLLKFELAYEKGQGYVAKLTPCYLANGAECRYYCPEYYEYFGTHTMDLVQSSRRSAKKEAEAIRLIEEEDVINRLIDHYIAYAEHKGKTIEVIGQLEV